VIFSLGRISRLATTTSLRSPNSPTGWFILRGRKRPFLGFLAV
jgi:hypothetical protein